MEGEGFQLTLVSRHRLTQSTWVSRPMKLSMLIHLL